ncbi:extracellular solute-binding protein [Cohnella hongkongensis]|uniref:Extracellular solute-binding protein n=1 Tax=Cohnella hongkongensis TaxID=178337 RepID=A0ABV9F638_9BACL
MNRKASLKGLNFIFLLILLFVTACSSSGSGPTASPGGSASQPPASAGAPAQEPADSPTVTILMKRDTDFPEDNPVIQEIRKRTGVNVQVESVVTADYGNRLNTLIVSGNSPDIFEVSKTSLKEMAGNGVIMPLDDVLKSNGSNLLENKGEYMKGPAAVDGKIYGIPYGWFPGNALAIRKDWLDNLGLEMPATLEEYEKVLRAFVNDDPDGNGLNDTIGLGLTFGANQTWTHLFTAFGVPFTRQALVDGKVVPWMLAPGYLDAIKYINKLYKEGLIDPEFATVPALQSYEKIWNGKVGAYNFNADGITQNWLTRYVEDPKPEFAYAVIKGPNGQGGYLKPVLEDSAPYTVISGKAKHPEAAMKVLDFLVSEEGYALTWAGLEGVHHKYNDKGEFEWISPYDDAEQLRNEGGYIYSRIMYRIGGLRDRLFNEVTLEARKMAMENTIDDVYLYELPKIQEEVGTILDDMEVEFRMVAITSNGDLDAMYEDFKKKYLAEGGNQWIEQATEIYRAQEKAENP